jgi:hypothetical protein
VVMVAAPVALIEVRAKLIPRRVTRPGLGAVGSVVWRVDVVVSRRRFFMPGDQMMNSPTVPTSSYRAP